MKTMAQIYMNYRRALSQAAKLEELASQVRRDGVQALEETQAQIRGGWTGENAESYLAKMQKLYEKLSKTASQLQNAATSIRRIARNTYEADRRAVEIANRRTYH